MEYQLVRESLFYRGHFSSRRFVHFYENDTFSLDKKVHFSTYNIDWGSFLFVEKRPPVIILRGSLFFFTPADQFEAVHKEITVVMLIATNRID